MINKKIFFIKQKMLAICHFYNRFSISDPYDSVEGSPDGLVPQEHKIWPSTDQGEANWIFFVLGPRFWVYAPPEICWNQKIQKVGQKNHPNLQFHFPYHSLAEGILWEKQNTECFSSVPRDRSQFKGSLTQQAVLVTCQNRSYLEHSLCYLWCASCGAICYHLLPPPK